MGHPFKFCLQMCMCKWGGGLKRGGGGGGEGLIII